jgi:LysM repeat protein
MTRRVEDPAASDPGTSAGGRGVQHGAADVVWAVCPFLVSAEGDWRSIHPTRDHRCGATRPPVAPALAKQRDLCLRPAHDGCATYRAGIDVRSAARVPGSGAGSLWPDAGASLLALEPARGRVLGGASTRGGQALLVGLMVLAFLVLVIARTTPPSSGGRPTSAPGAGTESTVPTALASPSEVVTPTVTPAPTVAPSASPASTPAPTTRPSTSAPTPGTTSYKVKSGDTLSSIAATHGTTVKKLKAANGLATNTIRPGQVLVIP